jgi:hypothetical protein
MTFETERDPGRAAVDSPRVTAYTPGLRGGRTGRLTDDVEPSP